MSSAKSIQSTSALVIPQPRLNDRRRRIVVHGVWMLFTLLGLAAVVFYDLDVPWQDDFLHLPYLTGTKPLTLRWLWSQHNEHRLPLPRLLMVCLWRYAPGGILSGMYLN